MRKVNLWPTTGWRSFAINHSAISAPCVSARQIFFGAYGITRSITRARVSVVVAVIGSPFEEIFAAIAALVPRRIGQGAEECGRLATSQIIIALVWIVRA